MHIRTATPEDVPALVLLWKQMLDYHAAFSNIYEYVPGCDADITAAISEYIGNAEAQLFVALHNERIAGYIQLRTMTRPPVFRLRTKGMVNGLYVDPQFRKNDVGRQLVQAAMEWFKGVDYVELQVVHGNNMASEFWKKVGFEPNAESFARKG
jgi:ribosomal protein S18 acetylase RimI-like enzyme